MEPVKLAHVVFATNRYDEMIEWYLDVFEARVQHRDSKGAFITYDDEHHRFAFMNLGPAPEPAGDESPRAKHERRIHHIAYTFPNLASLMTTYRRLRNREIRPVFSVRHGPTLSMYYADPDGNRLEFQIDLLDPDAANDFMRSDAFAANPVGERFDPDQLLDAVDGGLPVESLVFRSDQQPVAVAVRD